MLNCTTRDGNRLMTFRNYVIDQLLRKRLGALDICEVTYACAVPASSDRSNEAENRLLRVPAIKFMMAPA